MKPKTKSERLFEELCRGNGIPYLKIKTGLQQTPDYKIKLNGKNIVVEIKELAQTNQSAARVVWKSSFGAEIRQKIDSASSQLKSHSEKGFPCVLLIFGETGKSSIPNLEPNDFKMAMYGNEVLRVEVGESSLVGGLHRGGKRKFVPENPSSISALGSMIRENGRIKLSLYHNEFSKVKIGHDVLSKYCASQFKIKFDSSGIGNWVEVL